MVSKNSININLNVGCFVAIFFSWWTDNTLDYWCTYFSGDVIDVPFILSIVFNLFFGSIAMLMNLVSEIAKLCM